MIRECPTLDSDLFDQMCLLRRRAGWAQAVWLLALVGALSCIHASTAEAQSSIRNPKAESHVEQLFSSRSNGTRSYRIAGGKSGGGNVVDQLRLDTADGLLQKNIHDSYEFVSYRDLAFQSYTDDRVNLNEFEFEQSTAAEKMFFFEVLRLSNRAILKPAFGTVYDSVIARLKVLKNYTTVGLIQRDGGGLDIQQGSSEDQRLLEFRIHASARYGLEPRLRFSDHILLRYQALDSIAWLEYRYDF